MESPAFEVDLKEEKYSAAAIERIFKAYAQYFNYTGKISPIVKNVLSKQLLLLRIFFEVNENKEEDVFSICKYDIFEKYIKKVQDNSGEDVEELLELLSNYMLQQKSYDGVELSVLKNLGIDSDKIKKIMDSGILIGEKLSTNEETIAKTEKQIAYFVFDEIRDYYLARMLALSNIIDDNHMDYENAIRMLKELKNSGASCIEGVIQYIYVFLRTASVIVNTKESEQFCKQILEMYQIKDEKKYRYYWNMNREGEFTNLGMRTILTSGLPIMEFEIQYICDCLDKNPQEDGKTLFEIVLLGTLHNGKVDIDTYLDIVFKLRSIDNIQKVLEEGIGRDVEQGFVIGDFIAYYNQLCDKQFNKAIQIQKLAELFLIFFEFKDEEMQINLENFFYNLPNHDDVTRELMIKIKKL